MARQSRNVLLGKEIAQSCVPRCLLKQLTELIILAILRNLDPTEIPYSFDSIKSSGTDIPHNVQMLPKEKAI